MRITDVPVDHLTDTLEAIRKRAGSSITWPNAELAAATGDTTASQRMSDALWRAHRDRQLLLDLLDRR